MNEYNKYIRFDWAVKHMLRDKANFAVLEGLITVLLGEKITIKEILESESNQNDSEDKFNRVDIKAVNSKGHIILVEVQLTRQLYFLQRILYGTSKAITEHIRLGDDYKKISKVYSISILYCDMGEGCDYIYHGITVFTGLHTGDNLQITTKEKDAIIKVFPQYLFPEYFLIRVNQFNKIPENPIDEWVEYLKTGIIKENTRTPGLREAREKLLYLNMSKAEKIAYDRHLDNIMVENDIIATANYEGFEKGHKEGMEIGRAEGIAEGRAEGEAVGQRVATLKLAKKMIENRMPIETVVQITGLSKEDLLNI